MTDRAVRATVSFQRAAMESKLWCGRCQNTYFRNLLYTVHWPQDRDHTTGISQLNSTFYNENKSSLDYKHS